MSLRNHLPRIVAQDPRYAIDAYAFVLEALDRARIHRIDAIRSESERSGESSRSRRGPRSRRRQPKAAGHVTGQELCHAVRTLALGQYGLLAATVLAHWGIRSTSDIGEIVYNMIGSGDLEKTPNDSRADFDDVFDFEQALHPRLALALDEP